MPVNPLISADPSVDELNDGFNDISSEVIFVLSLFPLYVILPLFILISGKLLLINFKLLNVVGFSLSLIFLLVGFCGLKIS